MALRNITVDSKLIKSFMCSLRWQLRYSRILLVQWTSSFGQSMNHRSCFLSLFLGNPPPGGKAFQRKSKFQPEGDVRSSMIKMKPPLLREDAFVWNKTPPTTTSEKKNHRELSRTLHKPVCVRDAERHLAKGPRTSSADFSPPPPAELLCERLNQTRLSSQSEVKEEKKRRLEGRWSVFLKNPSSSVFQTF